VGGERGEEGVGQLLRDGGFVILGPEVGGFDARGGRQGFEVGGGERDFVALRLLLGEGGETVLDAEELALAVELERGLPGVSEASAALALAQLLGAACPEAERPGGLVG